MRKSLLVATLFFLFVAPLSWGHRFNQCFNFLFQYSYFDQLSRNAKLVAEWKKYKNLAGQTPATYDLSCSGGACNLPAQPHPNFPEAKVDLSNYELSLLKMKKKDSIIFGDKKKTLGDFLGAGNSTHVYVNGEKEKEVFRFPFPDRVVEMSLLVRKIPDIRPIDKAYEEAKASIKNYVELEKQIIPGIDHVKIIETDPENRYVSTSRVFGDKDGRTFLDTVLGATFKDVNFPDLMEKQPRFWHIEGEDRVLPARHRKNPVMLPKYSAFIRQEIRKEFGANLGKLTLEQREKLIHFATKKYYEGVIKNLSSPEKEMMAQLLEVNEKNSMLPFIVPPIQKDGSLGEFLIVPPHDPEFSASGYHATRQVVYDKDKKKWILLDWDQGDAYFLKPKQETTLKTWAKYLQQRSDGYVWEPTPLPPEPPTQPRPPRVEEDEGNFRILPDEYYR